MQRHSLYLSSLLMHGSKFWLVVSVFESREAVLASRTGSPNPQPSEVLLSEDHPQVKEHLDTWARKSNKESYLSRSEWPILFR